VNGVEQGFCQTSIDEEVLVSAITLNVLRFSSWPSNLSTSLNLCVYGDDLIQEAFTSLEKKAIGLSNLHVVTLAHLVDLDQCNALYISDVKQNNLIQVFHELKNKPILTIGINERFCETGGMVGLRKENGKLAIDINMRVIKESAMSVSSRLLSLSHIIEQ
jgi:hypothetical protein